MPFVAALAAFAWFAAAVPASALELPSEPGAQRTIAIFDHFCLEPMPALDRIAEEAAALGFLELTDEDLEAYRPEAPTSELKAWAFQDSGTQYVLNTTQGEPAERFREAVPAFADATSTTCSLVIGNGQDEAELVAGLSQLLGRRPDRQVEEPQVKISAWTAGTATLVHHIQYAAPVDVDARAVLSIHVLRKE